jgi:tRNA(fMet)-specific endonuclease VapC
MILLDTDHITIYRLGEHPRALALKERLRSAQERVGTTAVTLEEQMRGWLEEIGRKRDVRQQVSDYGKLIDLVRFFHDWTIMPFDAPAAEKFLHLRKQRVRIGTPDLKIAAIALVNDALLLSANLRDFAKVPGLRVENWLR